MAKFGLQLHAEKTRLIEFGQFAERNRKQRGEGKPETFTFLGFTHYCGKRRSNGTFIVWLKTAKKQVVAKLRDMKAVVVRRKYDPSAQVGEWLRKVQGLCVDLSRSWLADAAERGTFNSRLAARSTFSTEWTRISQTRAE